MNAVVLASLLPIFAVAGPLGQRASVAPGSVAASATIAASFVGSHTSDVFPPPSATVNPTLFPSEPVIGYPGSTATGVEPAAIQTAAAYAYNTGKTQYYPLVADKPSDVDEATEFNIFKSWGNVSPWYSVQSSVYGLPEANPLMPESCSVTQVHLLYRHGARYPTSKALSPTFASTLANLTAHGGFSATGDLGFLNTWTYKLGAEVLTPFGRLQGFELGVAMRQQYGHLLNNFTEQGVLPVFRTESKDRMVNTANNFAAGFFGVPEYLKQVNIEIAVEASGFNNTGAPKYACPNAQIDKYSDLGTNAAAKFADIAFASTATRIQKLITGLAVTPTHIVSMLSLCSYETQALGYSQFCKLFTVEDFKNYDYYYDMSFYYDDGAGSPIAAAQGLGYLQETVARFEASSASLATANTAINTTLDLNPETFPLHQSIYADATHDGVFLDIVTAFNLTALFPGGPLPLTKRPDGKHFKSSQVVPFSTHLNIQVLECSDLTPSKQIRFILNDAVLPLHNTYAGCGYSADGLCSFDTVLTALKARIDEIDYDHACYGNYTVKAGVDYNGLAPYS
ncbi:acid phosphatase [Phaffia rhodozyma]|uniref:Acid phosphatase n=1 Tax=Phaffia rhodozyma TaxID=264483 RepID=A0A0F7SJN3_PHARH|nr:acid phosphatase [Phaffia rhodozyma]